MHSNTIIMGKKYRTRQQNNNDPNQPSTNEPSTNDVRLTRAMRRENRSNKKKKRMLPPYLMRIAVGGWQTVLKKTNKKTAGKSADKDVGSNRTKEVFPAADGKQEATTQNSQSKIASNETDDAANATKEGVWVTNGNQGKAGEAADIDVCLDETAGASNTTKEVATYSVCFCTV